MSLEHKESHHLSTGVELTCIYDNSETWYGEDSITDTLASRTTSEGNKVRIKTIVLF